MGLQGPLYRHRPQKLEILESGCPLMVFLDGSVPSKVVFNTKCGSEKQGDCRSAARNLTLGLESQEHFSSRTQLESTAREEAGTSESHVGVRWLRELQNSFLIQTKVWFA